MPRRARLVVAVLAAVVLTMTGCTLPVFAPNDSGDPVPGSTRSLPPAAAGSPATWTPCPDVPKQLVGKAASNMTYSCASVSVPRNWDAPVKGQDYSVAMIRIRSADQRNRKGSLLVNPGGPGGSGIDTAVYLSFGGLPASVTDQFDIIGFDPRGVGKSSPIRCISASDQDASFAAPPDPVGAEFDQVAALNKKIADACTAKYGDQLPLFSTKQAAKDMDAIRTAVGDPKMTYLGWSYGTLLGATYAQLFPKNVRALVLDGAVDPTQSFVAGSEDQAKGFERAFTNFTNWCKSAGSSCPISADPRGAVVDALAKAKVSPVQGSTRDATPGWIFVAVISSLYTESGWQKLAKAIDDLQAGDATDVFKLADEYADRKANGTYSNLFDANLAVNCADADDVPTVDQIKTLQDQWRKKYPLFGAPLAVGMLPCVYWGAGKRDPVPHAAAVGAPPILVVGTTGDPATPYENTASLAKMLGVGHVLTWEGEGHTAYPSTACIARAVDSYLIDLTVPKEGTRCPAK